MSNSDVASTTFPSFSAVLASSTCCCTSSKQIGGQYDTLADALEKAFDTMLPLDKMTVDIIAKQTNECLFIEIKLLWQIYTLIMIQQL
jgi:hypothetical protein